VTIINPDGYVAICTLWTRKEEVLSLIPERLKRKVWGVGTLYTTYGINYLVHTLANTPSIERLIIYGADLNGSGEALVKLFRGSPPSVKLLWSLEKVRRAIEGVELVDLRESYARGDVNALVRAVEEARRRGTRRRVELKLREERIGGWPLPISGTSIYERSLLAAWVKAVYAVLSYGFLKGSEYGERQKELLNLIVTLGLYGERYQLERELTDYIPERTFREHLTSLLNPERGCMEYTYGERLKQHPAAGDQLEWMVRRLKARTETRRAVAVLWYHPKDMRSSNPPCIVVIQGIVTGKYYNHVAVLRSSDVYSGWPVNAYGQVKLAEYIASRLGLDVGIVALFSCSAHIYEHDWARARELVNEHEDLLDGFVPDPRGNFVFSGSTVEHRAPTGELVERIDVSKDRYRALKKRALLLTPDHAFWLGAQAFSEEEL